MKHFYFCLVALMMLFTAQLQAQTVVINESFEDGIPQSWTQEYVSGNQSWTVESQGSYPEGAVTGDKRLCLRNDKGQTLNFRTRLVTPAMDLTRVYQPILKFSHAQDKWTADFDTLRIWYRTDAGAKWMLLITYDQPIKQWQEEIIDLPAISDAYQLAFEGTDNLGRGIVIDDIQVRSKPECTTPHDLYLSNIGDSAATLGWQASLDADYFQLVLTKKAINPDTLSRVAAEDIIFNFNMDADSTTYRYRGLEPGNHYYFYCRSLCWKENSDWGSMPFRMNAARQIPFYESFAMPYTASRVTRPVTWTFGGNTSAMCPFVPSNTSTKSPAIAPFSRDSSMCLAFANGGLNSVINAGYYAYAATPELLGENINDCQVRFVGTVADRSGLRTYACSIIVGVMVNPEDINTFVPIDTCLVWGMNTFRDFCVDLSTYKGEGKYVAFFSRFNTENAFYIDDVVVERRPDLQRVNAVYVCPKDTTATFTWQGNAKAYNVLVTNREISNPDKVDAAAIVTKQTITPTHDADGTVQYTLNGLEPFHSWDRPYYIYVQAMNSDQQKTDWSYREPFVTTAAMEQLPTAFPMERTQSYIINDPSKPHPNLINIWGNDSYPYLLSAKYHSGYSTLYTAKREGCDTWVTFPRIDENTMAQTQISFFLSGSNKYYSTRIGVGLMTNPMDIRTFTLVEQFELNNSEYIQCYTNFSDEQYRHKGEYIALVWLDKSGEVLAYIDDVVIEKMSDCVPVTGLKVETTDHDASFKWNLGALSWEAVFTNAPLSESDLNNNLTGHPNVMYHKTINNEPVDEVHNLQPASHYYYYIRTSCGTEKTLWTVIDVITQCAQQLTIPYFETFSVYGIGSSAFPACWSAEFPWSYRINGVHCPYVDAKYDHTGDGIGAALFASTSAKEQAPYGSCIVSPEIPGDITQIKLTFFYLGTDGNQLYVGTIANNQDFSTFVPIDSFTTVGTDTWLQADVDMARYQGNNRRIAITSYLPTNTRDNNVYVDDISLMNTLCAIPFDIHAENVRSNDFTVAWSGKTSDRFEVVVSKTALSYSGSHLTVNPAQLIMDSMVRENSLFVDGLANFTTYYIYVRPTCGDSLWAQGTATTECTAIRPKGKYLESFEGIPAGTAGSPTNPPDCWTIGNATSTNKRYMPFPFASSYASTGSNVLRFYATNTYGPCWAAAPRIDGAITDAFVSFVACYSSASSGKIIFGVMTDPADLSTFVTIDSLTLTTSKTRFEYDMSEYSQLVGQAQYIAWRTPYKGGNVYAFLDDVNVFSNTCVKPQPSVSRVTSSSARVSANLRVSMPWRLVVTRSYVSAEQLEDASYRVPGSMLVVDTLLPASAKYFPLRNLKPSTNYYVAASAQCPENEQSDYVLTSFSTICAPVTPDRFGTVSFEEGEDYGCWILGNVLNAQTTQPYIDNTLANAHDGSHALYMYSTPKYNGTYAITQAIDIDDISRLQVTFYGYCQDKFTDAYAHAMIVGVISDPTDISTFTGVDTVYVTGNAYTGFTVSLASYEGDFTGEKGKHIAFFSEFDKDNFFYLDEISLGYVPSCEAPKAIRIDSVGENSARLSWHGTANQYRFVLAPDELKDSQKSSYDGYLLDTVVSQPAIFITGLLGGTQYFPYIQAICEPGDTSAFTVERTPVHTDCPVAYPVPYTCDFDHNSHYGMGVLPDCWAGLQLNTNVQNYPQTCLEAGRNNTYGLYLASATTNKTASIAVAPDLKIAHLYDYMLSFNARRESDSDNYSGDLVIGFVRDVQDIKHSFVALDTLQITAAEWRKYWFDFAPYKDQLGTYTRVAFMTDAGIGKAGNDNIFIDNVRIDTPPTCFPPEINVTGTQFTAATAQITTSGAPGTGYEVAVMTYDDYLKLGRKGKIEDKATVIAAKSTTVTVENLQPSTKYVIFARTVCSDSDHSNWSDDIVTFYTNFYYKDSYFFGFEREEGWERSQQSISDNWYLHPALHTGLVRGESTYGFYPHSVDNTATNIYSRTGKGSLKMNSEYTTTGGYIIFPAIEDNVARSLTFDARAAYALAGNVIGVTYNNADLTIGLIEQGKGIQTLQTIGKISLPSKQHNTPVNDQNNYLFDKYVINFTADQLRGKQIVMLTTRPKRTTFYLDNVKLDKPAAWSSPLIANIITGDTYVDITLHNTDKSNAYVMAGHNQPMNSATAVASATGFNTHVRISGLNPETEYTVYVQTADAPQNEATTTTSRLITTACTARNLDADHRVTFDFESDYHTVFDRDVYEVNYYFPNCWYIGSTSQYSSMAEPYCYPSLPQINKPGTAVTNVPYDVANLVVGRNNSNALRMYCTVGSYMQPYAVMPLINAGLDTMQLEFYGRGFAHTGAGQIHDATYMSGGFSASVVVGTMTDPTDFATFEPIDTIAYPYTNLTKQDEVATDPAKQEYWCHFTVPTTGAHGNYIAFSLPSTGLFIMDDITLTPRKGILPPGGTRTVNIRSNTATASWSRVWQPDMDIVVTLYNEKDQVIANDTVLASSHATTATFTGLAPSTTYHWTAYQTDGTNDSQPTYPQIFTTECLEIGSGYTCGFETSEGWYLNPAASKDTYKQTICWTYGNKGTTKGWSTSYPYNIAATATKSYAHSGNAAAYLYAWKDTYSDYIVTPAMVSKDAMDTLQLEFWVRPDYHDPSRGVMASVSYSGNTYARSIEVGTCTDPNDPATFTPLQIKTYSRSYTTSTFVNEANEFMFEHFIVPLKGATGPYVYLAASRTMEDGTVRDCSILYADDISITRYNKCDMPNDLKQIDQTVSSATVTWVSEAGTHIVQVASDASFAAGTIITTDTVDLSDTCVINSLQPATTYFWHVKALCDQTSASSWSMAATLNTSLVPHFEEDFRQTSLSNGWDFANVKAQDVFDNREPLSGSNNATYGWTRQQLNYGITGPHYFSPFFSSAYINETGFNYFWMLTPVLYLEQDKNAHLAFSCALTTVSNYAPTANPRTANHVHNDQTFMVIVSGDGGITWQRADATVWSDGTNYGTADYTLSSLPEKDGQVVIDLSRYAGRYIRIAFYRESLNKHEQTCGIHIGNIHVNYFEKRYSQQQHCQYEDADAFGRLHIDGDHAVPGLTTIRDYRFVSADEIAEQQQQLNDTLYQLDATYAEAPQVTLTDEACQGYPGHVSGFVGHERSGLYRLKLTSRITGCDSIVNLMLTVHPSLVNNEEVTLCPGEVYTWHNRRLTRSGYYSDTLSSTVTGCDSICNLALNYYTANDTSYHTATIREDELPYTYLTLTYPVGTKPGVYTDTLIVAGETCNAVVIHKLTVQAVTGLNQLTPDQSAVRKVIYNDRLYIIRDDRYFDVFGNEID